VETHILYHGANGDSRAFAIGLVLLAATRTTGLSRDDAYVLCSLAADLHVTQAVDQTKGVHAAIAEFVFE
jgi:acetamidase/formamidase